jgi:hypothetical protein
MLLHVPISYHLALHWKYPTKQDYLEMLDDVTEGFFFFLNKVFLGCLCVCVCNVIMGF